MTTPDYHQQEYWRGDIWGAGQLFTVSRGFQRYATPASETEFAQEERHALYERMDAKASAGTISKSTDGTQNHDAHYTWGALLRFDRGRGTFCDQPRTARFS